MWLVMEARDRTQVSHIASAFFTNWAIREAQSESPLEFSRPVGAQYATREKWRNNSRKNEEMETKQKQYPVVDVTGDRSKVRCCKEQ